MNQNNLQRNKQEDLQGNYEMRRVEYRIKLESEFYDEIEMTSEGLIVLWEDDNGNQKLKIENKKQRKEEEGDGW